MIGLIGCRDLWIPTCPRSPLGRFFRPPCIYISMRTKQGLAAARAQGVQLGRPKGSKNKKGRALDAHKGQIKRLLELEVPVGSITKIVNAEIERPVTYNTYRYYIAHDEELKPLLANRKGT